MGEQIALVEADTWQGLYLNSKLVFQDHTIDVHRLMETVLHRHIDGFDAYEVDCEWLDTVGNMPENLENVVLISGKTIEETYNT